MSNRNHHRFTVDDYIRMVQLGILTKNDRVELIRGEILKKPPVQARHAASVMRISRLFHRELDEKACVAIKAPVRLKDSMPEPDVALLTLKDDYYASGYPRSADALLAIEIADVTLEFDREIKLPIYAENGITEYWIINLIDNCLEVYRHPRVEGAYGKMQTFKRGQVVEIAALPGIVISVDAILV